MRSPRAGGNRDRRRSAQRQARGRKDEYRFIRADGSVVWLESDISVEMVIGEAIVRGSVRNITARKQAEEELQARNAELTEFNSLMVDRELRIYELKKEINELCPQVDQSPRYPVDGEEEAV